MRGQVIITASNQFQLIDAVSSPPSVPFRTEKGRKNKLETWMLCRFIQLGGLRSQIDFPLTITHQTDGPAVPDFLIEGRFETYEVEVTEATTTGYQRAMASLEERDHLLNISAVQEVEDDVRSAEIRLGDFGRNGLTGPPQTTLDDENAWCNVIHSAIERKADKDYVSSTELLVYENFGLPEDGFSFSRAFALVLLRFEKCPFKTFDAVHVLMGSGTKLYTWRAAERPYPPD